MSGVILQTNNRNQKIKVFLRKLVTFAVVTSLILYVGHRSLNTLLLPRACSKGGLSRSFEILFSQIDVGEILENSSTSECGLSEQTQIVFRRLSIEMFKTIRTKLKNVDLIPASKTDQRFKRASNWWELSKNHQYLISRETLFDPLLESLGFLVDQKPTYIVDITDPEFVDVYAYVSWR